MTPDIILQAGSVGIDWVGLIGLILGSSALSTGVTALINRKNNKQQREFNYQDKLEERIEKLERRLDRFEMRDNIYSSATACAHGCQKVETCPVLSYLDQHPVPEKQ